MKHKQLQKEEYKEKKQVRKRRGMDVKSPEITTMEFTSRQSFDFFTVSSV